MHQSSRKSICSILSHLFIWNLQPLIQLLSIDDVTTRYFWEWLKLSNTIPLDPTNIYTDLASSPCVLRVDAYDMREGSAKARLSDLVIS